MKDNKIVWLASYPKSGNTWFRAFLTALMYNEEQLDINHLKTNGIFSSRAIFEEFTDIDSTLCYNSEIKNTLPEVYQNYNLITDKEHLFIKVHDAYGYNGLGMPLIPTTPTKCAIYFIRNPLDIVGSLAHHNGDTIENTIDFLINDQAKMAEQHNNLNLNNQFPQLLGSWSTHVKSWENSSIPFPVLFMRYEDMLNNTFEVFKNAIDFIGLNKSEEEIQIAINKTSFNILKEKENKGIFKEKNPKAANFFRNGIAGNGVNELSKEQQRLVIKHHYLLMFKYKFL